MLAINSRQKLLLFFYASFSWDSARDALLSNRRYRLLMERRTLHQSLIGQFLKQQQASENKTKARENEHYDSFKPYIGIPELNSWGRYYMLISTCWHIINIVLNLYLIWCGEETFDKQQSYICHIPRLVFHEGLGKKFILYISLINSSLHIAWRIIVIILEPSFKLSILPYLLWNDSLIEKGSTPEQVLKNFRSGVGFELAQSIIFYRSFDESTNDIYLSMRPNRTPEARKRLYTFIDDIFALSIVAVLCTTVFFVSIVIRSLLVKHALLYEGCQVTMFDQTCLIRSFWLTINLVVLVIDNALLIPFTLAFAIILIFDLILYWENIETRVDYLGKKLPIVREINDRNQKYIVPQIERLELSGYGNRYFKRMHYSGVLNFAQKDIEREIISLRWMIVDFFRQVSQVNEFLSIVVLFTILIWLVDNGLLTMTDLKLGSNYRVVMFARICQLAGFLIMTSVSLLFFIIKQLAENAYIKIGTLMAFDPSLNKTRWIVLIEHYTTRPTYAITVYSTNKIYDHLTYLKVVSYTLSLFLIVESYLQ